MHRYVSLGESGLEALWEDGQRAFCRAWRADEEGNWHRVLVVLPAAADPMPSSLDRLVHEFSLREELEGTWALRPLALLREDNRTLLALEDFGGEPLERLLGAPMDQGRFLPLAIQIAAALSQVHRRGLVHKDINPTNILVDRASGAVRLTGFGIASHERHQHLSHVPPESLTGTLAFIAPEQTGRMNRSIDSRSDLYSLGVTFYQMLTGSLPFSASDAMGWVHCHVARTPVPPGARLRSVPAPVCAVVMKLLAKTAEERYQTAAGLEADLRRCLGAWEAHGRIDDFPLGKHDIPDRLLIPEKLYGREHEIDVLSAVFDRVVTTGRPQMLLVSGYSGIGKSAIVNELLQMLVPSRGLFASGKFDRYRRDVPYATLAQALHSLVRSLLVKSDAELASWRHALAEAVGPNGRLMAELVPELTLIIDEQPPVPDLPPQESQGRFQLVLRRLLGVFARPGQPLVLFLDDLQWLDAATLDLLEDLLVHSAVQNLMLIGAYRDNEMDVSDALIRKLDAIRNAGAKIEAITLAPLAREHLGQLIADALHCEAARAAPLAELVHRKTGGNPFFATQFLASLAEEGLLSFDHAAARWSWDLGGIHAKGYTDNVVDLMVGKLQRLSPLTQSAIKQLSCLGNTTTSATWSIIHGGSKEASNTALGEAVQAGLVLQLDTQYRFLHDRVHEAAYSLLGAEERAATHLRIGRLLMAGRTQSDIAEAVFDIANQFNRALDLITEASERDAVCSLNVIAGRRARAATAYASARYYLLQAAQLLADDTWQDRYDDTFALHLDLAECEYLTGNFSHADVLFGLMLDRARGAVDRAKVYQLQMQVYQVAGRPRDAVAAALNGLQLFDVTFPDSDAQIGPATTRELAQIRVNLGGRSLSDLLQAPVSCGADVRIISSLLGRAMSPMYIARPQLWPLLVAKAVNFFLRCGNTEESCLAYASYGSILVALGEIAEGFAMSHMATELNEKLQGARLKGQVLLALGACVNLWNRPFGTSVSLLEQAVEACMQVGDLAHAGYAPLSITGLKLERGEPLDVIVAAISGFESMAERSHNKGLQVTLALELRVLDELRGAPRPAEGDHDNAFDEQEAVAFLDNANYQIGIAIYRIGKLIAAFILGRHAEALAFAAEAQAVRSGVLAQIHELTLTFFHTLALTAAFSDAPTSVRERSRRLINEHQQKLQLWARHCAENFEDRAALLSAEIARIEGRELEAAGLYERAIRLAQVNGFIHIEALAHELAGRFYLEHALETSADAHMRHAVACYGRWGARAKVRQFEQAHPRLQAREVFPAGAAPVSSPVRQLDVATVIKASQALTREMLLPNLIRSLMTIALENAGATRGLLVAPQGEAYRIEAEALACGDRVEVRLLDLPMAGSDCPEAILRYVMRTREKLIVDDATQPNAVSDESYQRDRQPRSILCLPLMREGRLPGLLYLENTLTSHAFTAGRVALLELLAGQAAISLENTRLYADLQARELRFRQLVDTNMIGITFWEVDGTIHDANDAFLALLGCSRQELLSGKLDWWAMAPPEYHDADARALEQLRQTGTFAPYERESIRSDGSRIPILIGGAFEEGSQQRGVAFVLDLSERRRAEAERQARQLAEAANRAKSEFLATMSHELRTPLNAILGYAQILGRDQLLNERQHVAVQVIQHSGGQLLTLINDVLDLAKIEAGRFELHAAEFFLAEFLRGLIDLISVTARNKGLRLLTDWDAGLPARVRADEQCLRRVLLNLLSNGVKFTDSGSVTLRVRFSPPDRLRFEVSDTGIGIRADQLEEIFEPFGQVADPPRRAGGTGLGLTICRRLVASMGGELRARSLVGKGSTFWFELQVPVLAGEAQQAALASPAAVTGYEGPPRKILVVDDVVASRAVVADWLRLLGFASTEAVNGLDAVEKAAALRPDLIVMDLVMPGMDGIEAIESLRQASELREVPIIAVSASASNHEAARSLAAGASAFIAKPINFERLQEKLGELLNITWTYTGTRQTSGHQESPEVLIPPPVSEMEVLYGLAQQGSMSDISRRAEQIVSLGERYEPFARELQRLAKSFQSQAILELVERHRHSPTHV